MNYRPYLDANIFAKSELGLIWIQPTENKATGILGLPDIKFDPPEALALNINR